MLEAAVEVLKVPLMVLGGSGLVLAIGVIVSNQRHHGTVSTSADSRDPEPHRRDNQR